MNDVMLGLRTLAKKFVPNVHAVDVTADVIPAIDQTPPSSSRSGPPESPEQTALPLVLATVCNWCAADGADRRRSGPQCRRQLILILAPAGDDCRLADTRIATEEQRHGRAPEVVRHQHDPDVKGGGIALVEAWIRSERSRRHFGTCPEENPDGADGVQAMRSGEDGPRRDDRPGTGAQGEAVLVAQIEEQDRRGGRRALRPVDDGRADRTAGAACRYRRRGRRRRGTWRGAATAASRPYQRHRADDNERPAKPRPRDARDRHVHFVRSGRRSGAG